VLWPAVAVPLPAELETAAARPALGPAVKMKMAAARPPEAANRREPEAASGWKKSVAAEAVRRVPVAAVGKPTARKKPEAASPGAAVRLVAGAAP
jgi:hypothetical protein